MDDFGFPHFRKPPHDDNILEFWKNSIFADESIFSSRIVTALEMGFWKGSSTTRGSCVRPSRNLQKYERFSPNHAIYSKIPSRKMETWFATILVYSILLLYLGVCMCLLYIYIYTVCIPKALVDFLRCVKKNGGFPYDCHQRIGKFLSSSL